MRHNHGKCKLEIKIKLDEGNTVRHELKRKLNLERQNMKWYGDEWKRTFVVNKGKSALGDLKITRTPYIRVFEARNLLSSNNHGNAGQESGDEAGAKPLP